MKRSDMETQMKSRGRGGVPKSVGRPVGVMPLETSSRKPNPPRLPPASSSTGARKVSSSRASSTTSYRSLASGRSTRDRTEMTVPDMDIEEDDGQDVHFIDGPGNSACASARSLKQHSSEPQQPHTAKTISPAEILELCQEEDYYKVYEVDLHGADLTAIPDLEKFRKLRVLDLSGNKIKKISHLDFTQDLRDLKLYDNRITKLEGLDKLKELCNLQLQYNQIETLGKSLSGTKKLKWLRLDNNKLKTLETSELLSCVQLTILDLSCNQITNLSVITYLPNLEELSVSRNNLQKLPSLSRCKKLTELDLSRNQLSDLSAISGLPHLQILDISYNQLKSLSSLGKLKSLEDLSVRGNQISDLTGWGASLPKLQILNICDNMLTSWNKVCCLKELPELVELSLAGNPVVLEGGECPSYHTDIVTVLPNLEIVDGAHVKRSSGKPSSTPLMRPMSASSVVSVRQVDMQFQSAIDQQHSLAKSISDRFAAMKEVFDTLPTEPPPPSSSRAASSSAVEPPPPATPQSSRSNRRSRIHDALAFAATVPPEEEEEED